MGFPVRSAGLIVLGVLIGFMLANVQHRTSTLISRNPTRCLLFKRRTTSHTLKREAVRHIRVGHYCPIVHACRRGVLAP